MISLNNGWTWTWQGSEASLIPAGKLTIQKAIEAKLGGKNFEFRQGTRFARQPNGSPSMNIDEEVNVKAAVEEAKDSMSSFYVSAKALTPKRRAILRI